MTRAFLLALPFIAGAAAPGLAQTGPTSGPTSDSTPHALLDCRSASWQVSVFATRTTPLLFRLGGSTTEIAADSSASGLGITLRGTSRDPAFALSLTLRRDGGATLSRIPKGGERMTEEATCAGQSAFMTSHGG